MDQIASNEPARFAEAHGILQPPDAHRPPIVCDTVMLTNIERGTVVSQPSNGITVRFVARGEERYRIGGGFYRLGEGQLMLAPQQQGAEIDIRRSDCAGTLGLCAFLATCDGSSFELPAPMVIDASCSPVGVQMQDRLKAMLSPTSDRLSHAARLVEILRAEVPRLIGDIALQSDRIRAARSGTRLDAVRKVNIARAYLHSITNRIVGLDELSAAAGVSRFHLLRSFSQALGETPTTYHRRLRLELALAEARRRGLSLEAISGEFGFAGVSGLSHAYRRTFGRSPVWSKGLASVAPSAAMRAAQSR